VRFPWHPAPQKQFENSVPVKLDPAAMQSGKIPEVLGVFQNGKKLQTLKNAFIGSRNELICFAWRLASPLSLLDGRWQNKMHCADFLPRRLAFFRDGLGKNGQHLGA
jgi:hypothetical protein